MGEEREGRRNVPISIHMGHSIYKGLGVQAKGAY